MFFFIVIRHPPKSPLLPYTTLFRSRSGSAAAGAPGRRSAGAPPRFTRTARKPKAAAPWTSQPLPDRNRSEEHTSELQSRQYLVCRLLLEKKTNLFVTTKIYILTIHM